MSGILSGEAIRRAVDAGDIEIDPFRPEQMSYMSYDLRLGRGVRVYDSQSRFIATGRPGLVDPPDDYRPLDAAKDNPTKFFELPDDGRGYMLRPGYGYLMHTEERVKTNKYEPVLDGKSSVGRLFISVHQTAGFGDVGFDGQWTLEVSCLHPVIVYPGMLFAQIRFHTIEGEVKKYAGNYVGEASRGPVASKSWKQFKEGSK